MENSSKIIRDSGLIGSLLGQLMIAAGEDEVKAEIGVSLNEKRFYANRAKARRSLIDQTYEHLGMKIEKDT